MGYYLVLLQVETPAKVFPTCHSEGAQRPKNLVFGDKTLPGSAYDYKQIGKIRTTPKSRFVTSLYMKMLPVGRASVPARFPGGQRRPPHH
jgi:hypothetical protein